jgi:hypothetical protein
MTNANRPARHCLAVLVVVLAMAVHSAWAQRQALPEEGIDLIFLVDVSRSMFEGPGNDPQRIRWDAVLLSMDLLTSEDRVLIVPFNDKTPAEHEDHPNVWVPGKLPRTLFVPRSDEGPGIRSQVHGFAKNQRNDNRIQGDEWNGDNGGTGLLYALEKAKTLMGRPLPKRHRFIILLTDGYEDSEKKPAGLEHLAQKETVPKIDPDRYSEAMRKDPRFQKWMDRYADPAGSNHPESGTRVYTIGLGTKVDEALLALVAQKTGGHFRHLHKNGELIDYFRTLIWQLKGCWTKERKVAANAAYPQEQDLMGRIRDFGILSYKEVPGAIRNISKLGPDEALKSAWSDNDGNRKDDVKPVRPDENSDSYTYDYYDRGGRDDGERVDTSLNRSDNVRRLLFAKRTDKPIFTISEPGGGGSYQRYELVPVKVSMDMGLGFDADQFDLTVALRTTDNEERLLKGPLPLTFYPADNEFRCDVDLSGLPKGGATDGYSLAITATGKPLAKAAPGRPLDKNESLFDYKLEMPPIDILVENKLELTTDLVGMVLLSNEGKLGLKKTIKIQPKRPLRVNKNMNPIHLGVVLKSKLVDWDKKEVYLVTSDKSIELGPIERVKRGTSSWRASCPWSSTWKGILGRASTRAASSRWAPRIRPVSRRRSPSRSGPRSRPKGWDSTGLPSK